MVERTLTLTPATLAQAEALIERRGVIGLTGLFETLVGEETVRLITPAKSVDRKGEAP